MTPKFHIAIIDCAIKTPSSRCFNRLVHNIDHKLTFHQLPQLGIACMEEADAYIIFGSYSNVCDRLDWHQELSQFIKNELEKSKPVLGICFGHQLIADLFGGDVDRVKPEQENFSYHGTREIIFSENRLKIPANSHVDVFTSHAYEVKTIPESFEQIASSNECLFDGLSHKTLPFFSFQGHPEASHFFVEETINANREKPLEAQTQEKASQGGDLIIGAFIDFVENNYSDSSKYLK